MRNIKAISPCPIIEAVIQINCAFAADPDVVIGQIYSLLQDSQKYDLRIEKLPILNLPEEIRKEEPNLKDKPWYKIHCGKYFILIGLFGIALGDSLPYQGWGSFKKFTVDIFEIIKAMIEDVSSVGLKYLDFFSDVNIYEKINCTFCVNGRQITEAPTIFRTEIPMDGFVKIIQITNGVHVQNEGLEINNDGSLIEISLFTKSVAKNNLIQVIEEVHSIQKQSFFELLSEEYLREFNIVYEDECH